MLSNLRLLVADDHEATRDALARFLRQHGAAVELAAYGGAAMALYDSRKREGRPFDFLVIDVAMPQKEGGNGFDVVSHVRRTCGDWETPIALYSAHDPAPYGHGLAAVLNVVLWPKVDTTTELPEKILELLEGSNARKE